MSEERQRDKNDNIRKLTGCFKMVQDKYQDLVDTGINSSKKNYSQGKLEVYSRMWDNLKKIDNEGIDNFFAGSIWSDIKQSNYQIIKGEELKKISKNGDKNPEKSFAEDLDDLIEKNSFCFLKKRDKPEGESNDKDLEKIENMIGSVMKPIKKINH